jgi:hypothetical protein
MADSGPVNGLMVLSVKTFDDAVSFDDLESAGSA